MSQSPSFIKSALKFTLGRFNKKVSISKIEKLTKTFTLVEITGEELKSAKWIPGCKLQVDITNEFTFRTFTPIYLDQEAGKLSFLCYRRSGHPATKWVDALNVGAECEVFGPRESLNFSGAEDNVVFFGDETSFGAAKVLLGISKRASLFFEVNHTKESEEILEKIDVEATLISQRKPSDEHLAELAKEVIRFSNEKPLSVIYLTGRASSIQVLRAAFKEAGIENSKMKVRVYWADGKKGLD